MEDLASDTIEACRRGDVQAFAAVVAHYEKPLFAYVYRLMGGRGGVDPEDVLQEVFIKAYCRIGTFDPARGSRFTSWIYAIARNHCISLMRKNNPRFSDVESEEIADERSPSPHESACASETSGLIADAVAELDEPFRSAFILRHYEDMPYEDIAAIMECNVGTVKSRVARARERLAVKLSFLCSGPSVGAGRGRSERT
ncbi:MAG: sigma-70 family RNA polymerase sigma factor [Candidatus Sumerlaeia bacterium]